MSDAQSTVVGLKAQDCPGGGWTGMPADLEGQATVADCLAHGVCGCVYGGAVQHIERLRAAFRNADEKDWIDLFALLGDGGRARFWKANFRELRAALAYQQHPSDTAGTK